MVVQNILTHIMIAQQIFIELRMLTGAVQQIHYVYTKKQPTMLKLQNLALTLVLLRVLRHKEKIFIIHLTAAMLLISAQIQLAMQHLTTQQAAALQMK